MKGPVHTSAPFSMRIQKKTRVHTPPYLKRTKKTLWGRIRKVADLSAKSSDTCERKPYRNEKVADSRIPMLGDLGAVSWGGGWVGRNLLVNLRRFISLPDLFPPAPTNCPWVSEDEEYRTSGKERDPDTWRDRAFIPVCILQVQFHCKCAVHQ